MNGSCDVKRCRTEAELGYYQYEVCWWHWALHCDDTKPFNLKGALKIKEPETPKPKQKTTPVTVDWIPGKKLL